MQPTGGYPYDYDDFKFSVTANSNVTININNIGLGDLMARIVDLSLNTVGTIHNSGGSTTITFSEPLTIGDYYLEIYGTPTTTSYLYPYNFILQQSAITTGIETFSTNDKITVFPNPFNSQTTIYFNEAQKQATVEILDVLGNKMKTLKFTGKELLITKDEMTAGIYFLQLTVDNRKRVTKKIVIN
jgi:hypothetical protein